MLTIAAARQTISPPASSRSDPLRLRRYGKDVTAFRAASVGCDHSVRRLRFRQHLTFKRAYGGGTLYDIGVYCINAARNLFRAEPTHVSATSINSGLATLAEIDETTAAMLRFGDE
jgi:predicted dehydrogenase